MVHDCLEFWYLKLNNLFQNYLVHDRLDLTIQDVLYLLDLVVANSKHVQIFQRFFFEIVYKGLLYLVHDLEQPNNSLIK